MDIVFIILHYKEAESTVKSINCIIKSNENNVIVVVDNGSNNGTFEFLTEKYKNEKFIDFIKSDKNLGFANGNNLGISYVRKKYNPEFIVVLNSDVYIKQMNFANLIRQEYNSSKFAVMGPQIITKDGNNFSNPDENLISTKNTAYKILIKKIIKLILNYFCLNFFINDEGTNKKCLHKYDNLKRYENVKLHGSCLIFSKEYFCYFNGFYDKTFLYCEEDILFLLSRKKDLLTVYNPQLVVEHDEDVSTNSLFEERRKRNIFILKNQIKSLLIMIKMFNESVLKRQK